MKKRYSIYAIPDHGEPVHRGPFYSTIDADAAARSEARRLWRDGADEIELVLLKGKLAIENRIVRKP